TSSSSGNGGGGGSVILVGSGGGTSIACESAIQNKSSVGCDYYAVEPETIHDDVGGCFAAVIANTWNTPVTIQVGRQGQALPPASYLPVGTGTNLTYTPLPNGQLQPGQVAIVFLAGSGFKGCPHGVQIGQGVNVAFPGDGATHGTGVGDAFHITTSAP